MFRLVFISFMFVYLVFVDVFDAASMCKNNKIYNNTSIQLVGHCDIITVKFENVTCLIGPQRL